jgi:hypothetical protein
MHAWLSVPGLGVLDLSPKLAGISRRAGSFPFAGVAGDVQPRDDNRRLIVTHSDSAFERSIAEATDRVGLTAVYRQVTTSRLNTAMIRDPFGYVDSPLTVRLSRIYVSAVYIKAVCHLIGVREGRRRSVAGVSHKKAWSIVNSVSDTEAYAFADTLTRRVAA